MSIQSSPFRRDLPIASQIHSLYYSRPFFFWIFLCFVALCACWPGPKEDGFHFRPFLIFCFSSAIITFFITVLVIAIKQEIRIDHEKVTSQSRLSKSKRTYMLSDIVDFNWGNPVRTMSGRAGTATAKNEYIELHFKNQVPLQITYDEYENFDQIKNFFYNYCIHNKIITVRPLKERKRSRYSRG